MIRFVPKRTTHHTDIPETSRPPSRSRVDRTVDSAWWHIDRLSVIGCRTPRTRSIWDGKHCRLLALPALHCWFSPRSRDIDSLRIICDVSRVKFTTKRLKLCTTTTKWEEAVKESIKEEKKKRKWLWLFNIPALSSHKLLRTAGGRGKYTSKEISQQRSEELSAPLFRSIVCINSMYEQARGGEKKKWNVRKNRNIFSFVERDEGN